uniref:Uncharacterized protein MANES_06G150100 n=1 Tax=Rhizophora mucronata TaxID=61149 RepID=A0A2P2JFZ9_RHIMU
MLSLESMNGVAITPALLIRRFRGRPNELKFDAKFPTDDIELRSSSMASTLAEGISLIIASLTSLPADIFLTAIITRTPRNARTRAVSVPMPLDAPVTIAVRPDPSTPFVTSSAVDDDENPDGPFLLNHHILSLSVSVSRVHCVAFLVAAGLVMYMEFKCLILYFLL